MEKTRNFPQKSSFRDPLFELGYSKVIYEGVASHVHDNAQDLADVPAEPVHEGIVVERARVAAALAVHAHRYDPQYHVDKVWQVTHYVGECEDHDSVRCLFLDRVPLSWAYSPTTEGPRTPHGPFDRQRGEDEADEGHHGGHPQSYDVEGVVDVTRRLVSVLVAVTSCPVEGVSLKGAEDRGLQYDVTDICVHDPQSCSSLHFCQRLHETDCPRYAQEEHQEHRKPL